MYRVYVSLRGTGGCKLETLVDTDHEAHAWLIKMVTVNAAEVYAWGSEKLSDTQVRDWRARNGGG